MISATEIERFHHLPRLLERAKHNAPEIYSALFTRIYRNVDAFHDYRYGWWMRIAGLAVWLRQSELPVQHIYIEHMVLALIAERFQCPTYFVSRDLLMATMQTDTLPEIDWQTMHLPMPTMLFVIPKNSLKCKGKDILHLWITRARGGFYNRNTQTKPIYLNNDLLVIEATNEDGEVYSTRLNKPYIRGEIIPNKPVENEYDWELDSAESDFISKLAELAFNILFAMSARPEYVEHGQRSGTHKKSGSELWTPNIIGRKYATKRDPNEETGIHASPRMHWRRGHFRQQAYGTQKSEHKIIWIEAILVNAKVLESSGNARA